MIELGSYFQNYDFSRDAYDNVLEIAGSERLRGHAQPHIDAFSLSIVPAGKDRERWIQHLAAGKPIRLFVVLEDSPQ